MIANTDPSVIDFIFIFITRDIIKAIDYIHHLLIVCVYREGA